MNQENADCDALRDEVEQAQRSVELAKVELKLVLARWRQRYGRWRAESERVYETRYDG